jgi:phage shock protein E
VKRILVMAMVAGLAACSDGQPEQGAATAAAAAGAAGAAPAYATPDARPEVALDGSGSADGEVLDAAGLAAGEGAAPATLSEPERRVVYVDVRTPGEWTEGRVQGAIHIPYTELANRLGELEAYRDADIVLYCRTGRRSGIAEQIMTQAGFERLHNGGGLTDLARQGVPVER